MWKIKRPFFLLLKKTKLRIYSIQIFPALNYISNFPYHLGILGLECQVHRSIVKSYLTGKEQRDGHNATLPTGL